MAMLASIIGTGLSLVGSIQQAQAQKAQAQSMANIEEHRGKQEYAAAQRKAAHEEERGRYARSRAIAAAASSGAGGAETASVSNTIGDIAQIAFENAAAQRSSGEAAKSARYDQAAMYRRKGESDYKGSLLEGFSRGFGTLTKAFG